MHQMQGGTVFFKFVSIVFPSRPLNPCPVPPLLNVGIFLDTTNFININLYKVVVLDPFIALLLFVTYIDWISRSQ